MAEFRYVVPLLFFMILGFLVFFLVLVYPSERAEIFEDSGGVVIEIIDQKFVPDKITISVGTTVSWRNKDNVKHKITGLGFGSSVLDPGAGYSYTFKEVGVYGYSCEFYPSMYGQVIVK